MKSKLCLIACLIVVCRLIEATRTLQTLIYAIPIHQLGSIKKDTLSPPIVQGQIARSVIRGIDHDEDGDPNETDHCYAIYRSNNKSSIYLGGVGTLSIYNPAMLSSQWSATRMRLENGDNSIEAGIMVNEELFKDKKTHLYIRYMVGDKGCFNLECPGFIEISKGAIGAVPDKISRRGQYHATWRLSIAKHDDDGNWWLSLVYNNNSKHELGYWPKNLFTSLADHANQIEWGGEVYYPRSGPQDTPEMGCGYYSTSKSNISSSSFYALTNVIDENYREIDAPIYHSVLYANCFQFYAVGSIGYSGPEWGHIIFFGGPKL